MVLMDLPTPSEYSKLSKKNQACLPFSKKKKFMNALFKNSGAFLCSLFFEVHDLFLTCTLPEQVDPKHIAGSGTQHTKRFMTLSKCAPLFANSDAKLTPKSFSLRSASPTCCCRGALFTTRANARVIGIVYYRRPK